MFLWPVRPQLDPDDVSVFGFLSCPTVVAEPAPIRHCDVQAIRVKSCRAGLTAQQLPSWNTHTHRTEKFNLSSNSFTDEVNQLPLSHHAQSDKNKQQQTLMFTPTHLTTYTHSLLFSSVTCGHRNCCSCSEGFQLDFASMAKLEWSVSDWSSSLEFKKIMSDWTWNLKVLKYSSRAIKQKSLLVFYSLYEIQHQILEVRAETMALLHF